jgi:signal transduction histidine kinase
MSWRHDGGVTRWDEHLPDVTVGATVLVLGIAEIWTRTPLDGDSRGPHLLVALAFAVAAGLSRRAPFVALVLVWGTCALQLLAGTPVLSIQIAVAVVAFGCARWGRPLTVAASGFSIPVAGVLGYLVVTQASLGIFRGIAMFRELMDGAYRFSDTLAVGATILGLLVLAAPWLAGLALRATARAQRSEVNQERAEADAARAHRETEQAREIAQLREDQARLARDVHDVVGHSLAVILAQAESAQYLPDADPEALKKTMATIATSARTSLQDVRQVLSSPQQPLPARTGAFEQLVDGVRAGGTEVVATEVGAPQPLPPELEVVAHRVVQEMLTNAIRHGHRERPVHVERHWPEGTFDRDLRIEVRNVEGDAAQPVDETQPLNAVEVIPGRGLEGMRRRLDSVGGRLDVRRRDEPGGPTFTATAWVPVRAPR